MENDDSRFTNPNTWMVHTFTMLPKVASYDPEMTPEAFWIYDHILNRRCRQYDRPLTVKQVMVECKLNRTKFYKHLKILKNIGFLRVVPRFSKTNVRLASDYYLVAPLEIYGREIVTKGWPSSEEVGLARGFKPSNEACPISEPQQTKNERVQPEPNNEACPISEPQQTNSCQNPIYGTAIIPNTGFSSIASEEDFKKEEDYKKAPAEHTTTTSPSHSSNSHSQSTDSLAVKLLFAGMGKKDKPKQVDKPKNKTFAFDVSKEIKDCHNCYSEHMSRNGLFGGGLNKKKIDVWSSFLERFKTVSDGLKVINYVLTHWDTLKRKYRLTESLPAIYFFQTRYIDSISIEVLAKATTTGSRPNDYADFSKLADRVRAKSKWSDPDE